MELTFQVASRMVPAYEDEVRRLVGVTTASTPRLEADRQALIALIKDEAVFHGDFTLSSGKKATYYVDMRKLTLDHRAAPAIGRIMLDLIRDVEGVAAVGGLTLGADPIANAVMHESVHAGTPVDAFVVRKEPKDHGRGRQVEGADVVGKRVVVVEDTSTTGQSALKAVEALRREGAEPVAVAVIVDRRTGAQAAVEAEGLRWLAAIDLDDLGLDPQ
jgi:orotate phosphoribosyltransferase